MSSEHDETRGGSLEDIRVDDVEIDSPLQYNVQQLKRRWKAFLLILAMALTSYAVYWVENAVTLDVIVFGVLAVGALLYTGVMIRSDLELE
ncbi:hypothetical protein [Salinirussus salinus]|jgi:hypothetical protein|uniref:hypothetical protein n=1 Tax=Salinirussus salinus TaxID=1198300 RepID=UPI00135C92DA|nr:hypothetical protein [Salinirussus salinus]